LRQTRHGRTELDLRKETKVGVWDEIEIFRRRQSLMLPGFEKDITECPRGWPALFVSAVWIFRVGVFRKALVSLMKCRLEVGRQGFRHGHHLRIADHDDIVAGRIVFPLPVPDGPHPQRKPLHRRRDLGMTFQ
jgi:hypothetical protein